MDCNVLLISSKVQFWFVFMCERFISCIFILSYVIMMRHEHVTFSNIEVAAAHEPLVFCVGFALSRWSVTPCERYLFGPLKQPSGIGPFESNEKVEMALREWLRLLEPDFFLGVIFKLMPKWDKCLSVFGRLFQHKWRCSGINTTRLTLQLISVSYLWPTKPSLWDIPPLFR